MRTLLIVALVAAGLSSGRAGVASGEEGTYRQLPALDLSVFASAANPEPLVFGSRYELVRVVEALAPRVRSAGFEERKEKLLRGVEEARILWEEEALVVVRDWYGTGMARGRLVLTSGSPGVLAAAVVWAVPPPPVTPDTAVFRAAFVVSRGKVKKVVVTGRDPAPVVLSVPE